MPYRFEWLCEERIKLFYMYGQVTADDFRNSNAASVEAVQSVSHNLPVHIILDGRNVAQLPNMGEMLGVKFKRAPNTGWVVMILSTNRLYKFIGSSFSQMIGLHFRIVESWSDAVSFLAEMDSTLPDLTDLPEKMEHSSPLEE
jgi:hypothetical protein